MDAHLLSPAQAADLLRVSTRTLRRWSATFAGSLSESGRRSGRKRAYSSQDVDTFRRAQEMLNQNLTLPEVAARLPIIEPGEPTTALTLSPEADALIVRMAETVADYVIRLERLEAWARGPWWRRILGPPGD